MKQWAKQWLEAGHPVIPIAEGSKRPMIKWGTQLVTDVDKYKTNKWAIRCDKVTVIDCDKYKSGYTTGWIPQLLTNNLIGTKGGGTHAFYAYHPEIKRAADPNNSVGVDIKTGKGSYVVIYGPPPTKLHAPPQELVDCLSGKTANVRKLLSRIDPDTSRDKWLPIVTAVKGMLGERGLYPAYYWSRFSTGDNHAGQENFNEFSARYAGLAKWEQADCLKILGGEGEAPKWELESYDEVETGDAEWILEEFLPKGEITTLTGEPGVGKTRAALYIAAMNALGKDMPCFTGSQAKTRGKVLFWGPENDDRTVVAPIIKYMGAGKVIQRIKGEGFNLGSAICKDKLYQWMRSGIFDIIIIDPLYDFARSVDNDNSLVGITECMEQLNSVAQETGVSVIGIMHTPKGAKARDINDRTHGSQGWAAKPRMRLLMQQTNGALRHDTVANPEDMSLIIKQKNSKGRISDGLAFVVEPKTDPAQPHLSKSIGVSRCVMTVEGRPSDLEKKYLQPKEKDEDEFAVWDDLKEQILNHKDRKDIEVNKQHIKGLFAVIDADILARYAQEVYKWKKYKLKQEGYVHKIHSIKLDYGVYYGVRLEQD